MKKFILLFICSTMLFSCSSTSDLWKRTSYEEVVTGFYLDDKMNLLIVKGDKFGYVFNIDGQFKDILLLSRNVDFVPSIKAFTLAEDGAISGSMNLFIESKKLNKQERKKLIGLGFRDMHGRNHAYRNTLNGYRYDLDDNLNFIKLSNTYPITINHPPTAIDTAGKIFSTPKALVIDSVYFATVVIPVGTFYTVLGAYMYIESN